MLNGRAGRGWWSPAPAFFRGAPFAGPVPKEPDTGQGWRFRLLFSLSPPDCVQKTDAHPTYLSY
jgi:hypothetical protein